jgi:hypothetical protein
VDSRLVITDRAEVIFVSSEAQDFVTKLEDRDGTGVFSLGRILAECWKLSGLVAQLYRDIGHVGQTFVCVAMVGTEGTHLGGVAPGFSDPRESHRRSNLSFWASLRGTYPSPSIMTALGALTKQRA